MTSVGTSYVLGISIYDPATDSFSDHLSVIGGAPLNITDQQSLENVFGSISSIGPASGIFSPGVALPLSFIPNVTQSNGLTLSGTDGTDRLVSSYFDDVINTGAGNDRFDGGAGTDRLWGDPGEDAFDLATQVGADVVFDFGNGDGLTVRDVTIGQLANDLVMV